MDRQLKKYYVDDFDSEVVAVSLVDYPAVEKNFVAFSKQEREKMSFADEEKRMISGVVLRPDFPIYRINEFTGEEYFLVFGKRAVERLAQKYMRDMNVNNWSIDHERPVEGIYTVESWIKTSNVHDKSIALGLDPDIEVGSWFITAKVDSDELWQEVRDGKRWYGFSIESWISMVEESFKKQNKNKENEEMNEQGFIDKLKELFNEYFKNEEPNQEEIQMEEQPAVAEEADDQTHHDEVVELKEETPVAEDTRDDYKAEAENLRKAVEDLTAKLGEANSKIAELSKQPSAEPVNVKASAETKGDVMDTIRALREGTYFKG